MKQNAKKGKGKGAKKKLPYEWGRIAYFFEFFEVPAATEHLWEMLKLALTNGNEEPNAKDRSNMIFFFEYTRELYENVHTLPQKKINKP